MGRRVHAPSTQPQLPGAGAVSSHAAALLCAASHSFGTHGSSQPQSRFVVHATISSGERGAPETRALAEARADAAADGEDVEDGPADDEATTWIDGGVAEAAS